MRGYVSSHPPSGNEIVAKLHPALEYVKTILLVYHRTRQSTYGGTAVAPERIRSPDYDARARVSLFPAAHPIRDRDRSRNTANAGTVCSSPATKNVAAVIPNIPQFRILLSKDTDANASAAAQSAPYPSARRNAICVTRITIHTKNIPAHRDSVEARNAFAGAKIARRIAAAIPADAIASARPGTPFYSTFQSIPEHTAREQAKKHSSRKVESVLQLDSAAVITTVS